MLCSEISGYKVVPLKFSKESNAQHWLYMKEHSVREKCAEKPKDRTLFILGVPPYCTQDSLKNMFSVCGNVNSVFLQEKPSSSAPPTDKSEFFPRHSLIKGFKVAYIVFESFSGLENALNLSSTTPLILSTEKSPVVTGLKKWCLEYNKRIINPKALQADIDSFMREYDIKEEEMMKKEKEGGEPDEEGWVTVTKRGRNPGFARKESVENRILGKERKKRSKKVLLNFYRHQIKEAKMNHLISLRQKFEEDKKKIAILKQTRKFKPF